MNVIQVACGDGTYLNPLNLKFAAIIAQHSIIKIQ